MDLSLARYFLKWSWLSSTASSRTFLFLSAIACRRKRRFKLGRGQKFQSIGSGWTKGVLMVVREDKAFRTREEYN